MARNEQNHALGQVALKLAFEGIDHSKVAYDLFEDEGLMGAGCDDR